MPLEQVLQGRDATADRRLGHVGLLTDFFQRYWYGHLGRGRIEAASGSLVASFARGIIRDRAAVRAAITEPWSNGQTEGHVNRLKVAKRQMYGRAKIDLLEARLIGAV